MIAVIETITGGLSHEMFNAGMIYQLRKVYSDEEIIYFCEKEQGKYVKRILDAQKCENVTFSYIERIYLNFEKNDIAGNKKEYIDILRQCKNAKFIIVLSLDPVNSGLLYHIMRRFSHVKFGVCIHGAIEMILPQNAVKLKRSLRIFHAVKEYWYETNKWKYFKNNLEAMSELPNCNIILYSDRYKEYRNCMSESLYNNITVLNLPYVFSYNKTTPRHDKLFKIGIMPSSAAAKDRNCIKLIEYMDSQRPRIKYPYKFLIFNYNIGNGYKNVGYITGPGRTRKEIEDFMKQCDWMLIPYDEKKYVLSSSGVMFDCIEAERPFFVLGSYSFTKAIEAGCGIRENFIELLGEKIIQQINENNLNYGCYYENVREYKKRVEEENLEKLERIFGYR